MAGTQYRNNNDTTGDMTKRGSEAERNFNTAIREVLGEAGKAEGAVTWFNDRNNPEHMRYQKIIHADFRIVENGKTSLYEIKGRKKFNAWDGEPNDGIVWIEFKTVSDWIKDLSVRNGWMFGKADFIAFESKTNFLSVDRLKLIEMVTAKCDLTKITNDKYKKTLYEGYTRWGKNTRGIWGPRYDLTSFVLRQDVLDLPHRIIVKPHGT
jgi:hypothetical protein